MMTISIKLSKNYSIDILFLHFLRSFKDGLSLLNVKIGADWYKGDHNPQGILHIVFLNFTIIEINVYNKNHIEGDGISYGG